MLGRFDGLPTFLSVARQKSFRAAARELGVTPGAVSQAVRALELKLGLPLFQRTTRRVSLTDAGEQLFARVAPAAAQIEGALDDLAGLRDTPSGLLRLTVPQIAGALFLEPVLPRFHAAYPEVEVEISLDDARVDLAANGFDAGIRVGDALAPEMLAVRLTEDLNWGVFGAPAYFIKHGHPKTPRELLQHQCIRYRYPSGALYRWELNDHGRAVSVDAPGRFTVNEGRLALSLARAGVGLMYGTDRLLEEELKSGALESTLATYTAQSPGFYLYFAARSKEQPKLRAFIETLLSITGPLKNKTKGARPARR
jgi:DNA-binding transcriptional LysR family regulator